MELPELKDEIVQQLATLQDEPVSEYILHLIIEDPPGSIPRRLFHRACIELVREVRIELVGANPDLRYHVPIDE